MSNFFKPITALEAFLGKIAGIYDGQLPKPTTRKQLLLKKIAQNQAITQESLGMKKSKNMLKIIAKTTTKNGVAFTVNSDFSITCNGTATADSTLDLCFITLSQNVKYTLTGCPAGGSNSTYKLYLIDTIEWNRLPQDKGNGITFSPPDTIMWKAAIKISSGQICDDLTFYPMLRKTDMYDDAEYEPFSEDLQTQINKLREQITAASAMNTTVLDVQGGDKTE